MAPVLGTKPVLARAARLLHQASVTHFWVKEPPQPWPWRSSGSNNRHLLCTHRVPGSAPGAGHRTKIKMIPQTFPSLPPEPPLPPAPGPRDGNRVRQVFFFPPRSEVASQYSTNLPQPRACFSQPWTFPKLYHMLPLCTSWASISGPASIRVKAVSFCPGCAHFTPLAKTTAGRGWVGFLFIHFFEGL